MKRFGSASAILVALAWVPGTAAAGECTAGLCGTPQQSGGGGGGGGGSILVNMTDRGDTYQFADDFDNDGIEDEFDDCPFAVNVDQADADGDGVGDVCDNCRDASNPDQLDLDGDHLGNACDTDKDNDGFLDGADNCAMIPNPTQDDCEGDNIGDLCDSDDDQDGTLDVYDDCRCGTKGDPGSNCNNDSDGDGFDDAVDNCPSIANGDQQDLDGNAVGDACDDDKDGDGLVNWKDNCPDVPNPDVGTNGLQIDRDHDGLGDAGGFAGGAGSCDWQECYVVDGDAAHCLDPLGAFATRVAPNKPGPYQVGEEIVVALYTNRLGLEHEWTAAVASRPQGSDAKILNAIKVGTTVERDPQVFGNGCARQDAAGMCVELYQIKFTPDAPGQYKIAVNTELPAGDPQGLGVQATYAAMTIGVEGESAGASGCAAAPVGLCSILLALLPLLLRRRG